jgi:hypothetical protein
MEHTNLFFYKDKAALEAAYPDGKVDVIPGVAYARGAAGENGTTLFNKNLIGEDPEPGPSSEVVS